jgi:hypothetical protein
LGKADESHGFLNDDVENRAISTPISGESNKDETNKPVSYYEQIVNEKKAGSWGRCMQIIYQVWTITLYFVKLYEPILIWFPTNFAI